MAIWSILGASIYSPVSGGAAVPSMGSEGGAVGTYLLPVTAPGFSPFQGLLTLHGGRGLGLVS